MQFLVIGRFCIVLDEIVCIYADDIDVNVVLKHPVRGITPTASYILNFEKSSYEAERLLKWARRHSITLDD